jgi:hypothetical protein
MHACRSSSWMIAAALCFSAGVASAAQTTPARITFQFDFPGEMPPHYRIDLAETGEGKFQAPGAEGLSALDLPFHLPARVTAEWFAAARELHRFDGNFEARRKVAFSGNKTLRYDGPDGVGETTLNYTEDKRMAELISNFLGIGCTLQVGQRFASDARFHPLGLDADMLTYKESLKNRQALYPEIIAPILQQLVDNPDVMTHVQREASAILQSASAQ